MRSTRLLLLPALLLCLGAPALAGPDKEAHGRSLAADLTQRLERAVAAGVATQDFTNLYRAVVLEHGDVQPALDWLAALHGKDTSEPDAKQQGAAWVAANLSRHRGDLREALRLAKQVQDLGEALDSTLLTASLEDALGNPQSALAAYTKALAALTAEGRRRDPQLETRVRLRMALLGKDGTEGIKEALVAFAKAEGRETALKNRVAIVLALKEHPKEAADIFEPQGESTPRFRHEIRLADWALAAHDAKTAQAHAWTALANATLGRDRRYSLSVLVEAHRKDETLPALIERFATTEDLDEDSRHVWIDLLRETGQIDEALRLFRESAEGRFTVEMRRELLEMCRESGKEDVLLGAYRDLIREQPEIIEWREGLARHHLERGAREAAKAVWADYLEDEALRLYLLAAAESLQSLGLDELAVRACETAIDEKQAPYAALIFLFQLHKRRGRMDEAENTLERMDALAPDAAPERMQLAEAYEQLGRKDKAVEALEKLSKARGPDEAGEDLDMRLAWLYSEVDEEEKALARWLSLWRRIHSIPRRRYVEDRLMTVASRLGKLADIAIELEEKLMAGEADARDSGLLVRLYTKANDAVSATEVIDEYMKKTGGDPVKTLVEKGRVFLACTDYHSYEQTIQDLIEVDPEGKPDYLRQLAMSYLERGKPDLARDVLLKLKEVEKGADSAEFEAGVLALAGLREEAVTAYRRGIALYPDRIESYLLMANLLRELGLQQRAIGMFQHLAETAGKDDLFTIAIDGLLNMEATPPVLRWARRITLERLAGRHDKMYLYQLLSDLSEEIGDRAWMLRALESGLPIAGVQRSSVLRELMDLARTARGLPDQKERHLTYGRRLIGLGEIAPPQVYLDLGTAFIQADEVTNAWKTFALATEVPDYAGFQRQVATAFEQAGYLEEALRTYERLLVSQAGDVSLLAKVGELQEQLGRDERAAGLYARAMDRMLERRLLSTITKDADEAKDPWSWRGARNVDEFDQHYPRVLNGVLTVLEAGEGAEALLVRHAQALRADLMRIADDLAKEDDKAKRLSAYPRVASRLRFLRRVAIAAGRPDRADAADLLVLERFPEDEKLLPRLVRERLDWGLVASARRLLEKSPADEETKAKLRFLVGAGSTKGVAFVPVPQAARLYLPLLAKGKTEEARVLLRRVDFTSLDTDDLEHMPVLLSAAVQMEDGGLALSIGRHWVRTLIKTDKQGRSYYSVAPMVSRIGALIEDDKFKSLCQYIVSLILQDVQKAGNWLNLIPLLQANFEEPLLDDEQVSGLLEEVDGNRWYWVGSFFSLVRDRDRPAALRRILPKVPKTRRMQFLLSLLDQIQDEIGPDFADFIAQSFDTAVADLDQNDKFVWYQFLNIANGDKNLELRLRLAKVPLERGIDNDLVRAAYAVMLQKLDRPEEALEDALRVYGNIIGKPQSDFHANMARQMITQAFLPKHTDAFIAHLDKVAEGGAPAMDITRRRLELARRANDAEVLLAALRLAVEDHPDNDGFKNQLYHQLNRAGRRMDAMAILTTMAEKKPKDAALKRRLLAGWRAMHQPIKALAVKRELEALQEKKEAKKPDDAETAKKTKRFVSPADLKKAVDEERFDDARRMLRRMWRRFPVGGGNRRFTVFQGSRNYTWPVPRKEPTEAEKAKAKQRARGGLASFSDAVKKPAERIGMYEALSRHPFAETEMRRQLRTWSGMQLSGGGELIESVAAAMVNRMGRKEAAASLLAQIDAGRAGKLEYALLLGMLEEGSERAGIDAQALLDDLARTVKPSDTGQVMRLARIWARLGGQAEAARLYKWCAAQSPGGNRVVTYVMVGGTYMPQGRGVDSYTLVKEVGEELEGDLRIRTIEEILALADPGHDQRFGPTARDGYESLVLKTWIDVLGEDAALERCRAICLDVPDLENGLRRRTARLAAALLARAGEHEAAIRCLEVALCSLEAPGGIRRWYKAMFTRHGSLAYDDIRRLFPADASGFADARGWFEGAAKALTRWLDADRAAPGYLFRPMVILALRLHQAGAEAPALALLDRLQVQAEGAPSDLLWVIDLARALGQADRAYELEKRLLAENQLIVTRLAEVLDHVAEREGPAEALDLAEQTAAVTLHPDLLEALVRLSDEADELERMAHWKGVRKQAEAAREALEAKQDQEQQDEERK